MVAVTREWRAETVWIAVRIGQRLTNLRRDELLYLEDPVPSGNDVRLPPRRVSEIIGCVNRYVPEIIRIGLQVIFPAACITQLVHAIALPDIDNGLARQVADADRRDGILLVVVRIKANRFQHFSPVRCVLREKTV